MDLNLSCQVIRVMKLTTVILLSACLTVSAGTYSQITLSEKNTSLQKVFKKIQQQSGFEFIYPSDLLQSAGTVSVQVANVSLDEALKEVLKDKPLSWSILEKTIIIKHRVVVPPTLRMDLAGKIVNENNEPVVASIIIKGTTHGTTSNGDGTFVIKNVESGGVLVITGINIETREIKLPDLPADGNLGIIRVKTRVSEEKTVTISSGYQRIPRERMVGSYTQLDSAAYVRRAGMNIIDRLDGTVPGVLFNKKANVAPLQIRGISTLSLVRGSNHDPLVIVDNFPYTQDINTINPNDVVSITILKDAAATSIWGARAGNGVIVITTKRANYNQPLQVNISSNITLKEKPDLDYFPILSSPEVIDIEKYLFDNGYFDGTLSDNFSYPVVSPVVEILERQRQGIITHGEATAQIDHWKHQNVRSELDRYVYRPAISQQHYLNISGGSRFMHHTLSVGFNDILPEVKHLNSNSQYTINTLHVLKPVEGLEIELGLQVAKDVNRSNNNVVPQINFPYAQLADASGNALSVPLIYREGFIDTAGGGKLLDWHYRPLDELRLQNYRQTSNLIRVQAGISYKITNWLETQFRYQYTDQGVQIRELNSLQTYFTRNTINNLTRINGGTITRPIPLGGILDIENRQSGSSHGRAQLNINKSWGDQHQLTALFAGEFSQSSNSRNSNLFYGYDEETGTYASNLNYMSNYRRYTGGSERITQGDFVGGENYTRFVSLLANASYTFNRRYTFYASARRDGSNVFGVHTNNKWKPLWSAGIGWDISKEHFFKVPIINDLKLRASYGYMGNVNNSYSGLPTIFYSYNPADYTNFITASPSDAPNPDLRWEQVRTINVGIDFSVLNRRISGSLDVFQKKCTDLIASEPVDQTTGISNFTINSAHLEGNGFEWQLRSQNLTGAFKWETGLSMSYVKMVVTKLFQPRPNVTGYIFNSINEAEGKVAFGLASFRWAGLDPLTGDPQGYLGKDISKDYYGIYADSLKNQVWHGSALPLYSGFLYNSFTWKHISLSANITYRLGYYYRKPTIEYYGLFTMYNLNADYRLRWQQPGDEQFTNVPSMVYPEDYARDGFYANSSIHVHRADNIRLQDVRLQYSIDGKKAWWPFRQTSVFLYANNLNLIMWRADGMYSAPDPDFGNFEMLTAPVPKSWTAGISLQF